MDMDRILGLSQGKLVEFDTPANLVGNKQARAIPSISLSSSSSPQSMLYGMIQATGKTMAKRLMDVAAGRLDVFKSLEELGKKEKESAPVEKELTEKKVKKKKTGRAKNEKKE